MELGATVCLPRNPLCATCPLAEFCRARQAGTAAQLPVKLRKAAPERIDATVLIVRRGARFLVLRRAHDARRMAGFWELPAPEDLPAAEPGRSLGTVRHTITHHHYSIHVRLATVARTWTRPPDFLWVADDRLSTIPLATAARKALRLASKNSA
jgi:A/G-specific adenine glycosylase